ncbi:MAG: hypothetical protein KA984_05110 [Candidatus Cloacimonetes bacterium]|nr:hypothetical protein [Candidatus Cloacimonadota bacterium]
MKPRSYLMIGLMILILGAITACASLPASAKASPVMGYRPDWWLYQAPTEDFIYCYGVGLNTSVEKSLNAATRNAQDEAIEYLEEYLQEIVNNFSREAGVVDPKALSLTDKLVHSIAGARYSSSYAGKTETHEITETGKSRYKSWVQIVIPKAEINANLINNLSYDESLSSLFKNSPSYRRMELLINQR